MKATTYVAVLTLLLSTGLHAQVSVVREVSVGSRAGKTKMLKSAPKEIHLAQFAIWFKTSRGDAETSNAITARSEFDLTGDDALAVTDMARDYLQKQLESKGYTVKANAVAEVEQTKTYKKFAKKGGGTAVNAGGLTYHARNDARHNERLGAFASGVTNMYLGSHAKSADYGKVAREIAGKEGRVTLNIITHFDYSTSDAKLLKSQGKVAFKFVPRLRVWDDVQSYLGQTTLNYNDNKQFGTYAFGGQELVLAGDTWCEVVLGEDDVFYFKTRSEQFKAAAFELLKTYVDQLVVRIDEARAKG